MMFQPSLLRWIPRDVGFSLLSVLIRHALKNGVIEASVKMTVMCHEQDVAAR